MNQRPTFTEGKTFEVVRDHHFIMTEEDMEGMFYTGYFIDDGGPDRFRGHRIGDRPENYSEVILNTPLCKGCDGPITDALCKDCELLHADLLPELRAENGSKWQ
jgi:hypothetical protein